MKNLIDSNHGIYRDRGRASGGGARRGSRRNRRCIHSRSGGEELMAEVTAAMVKALRERTGAGMMDCKRALVESDGDMDKAEDWLRAKGFSRAAAKATWWSSSAP